ncbi:MAG TPA: hypothetical protein VL995_17700 [Cellvibrio sp.]|jgi:hypothetical protein|nr:hypothetical protein [Cellvibrio sp.]
MNARRFFLLFFLCALIPMAAAKLSLSFGWFSGAATNKGQWLDRELQIIPAFKQGDIHWTIAYVNAGPCMESCLEAVGLLHQLYAGLGRKQLGVQAMFISDDGAAIEKMERQFAVLKTMPLSTQLNQLLESSLDNNAMFEHQFFIINQQGVALLRYPLEGATYTHVAADLRADLLRLYNYDRSRL